MIPKIFSRPPNSTPRTEAAPNTTTATAQQPAMPNVRKTSHLPGGLRDLADKVTARRQKKDAQSLSDTQLMHELSNSGLNGRGTRAVHREAKKRIREGRLQWPQQQHAAPPQNTTPAHVQEAGRTTLAQLMGMSPEHAEAGHTHPAHSEGTEHPNLALALTAPVPAEPSAIHVETPHAAPIEQETESHTASASSTPGSSFRHDGETNANEAHTEPGPTQPAHTEEAARPILALALRPPSPDHAAAAHAEGRHAPPAGPVFDPETGALNKAQLRQMVDALKDALPVLPADLARSHARSDGLRAKLMHQLGGISTIAADNTRKAPHEVGLAVRDTFAAVAKTARQLAKSLGNHEQADAYRGIAALLNEFKRTHLSGSAHDVMSHYATKEADNLERKAPGISQGKAGTNVGTSTSASLSVSAFPTNRYANAHVSATAGGGKGRTYFTDDDGDVDYWPNVQAFANVSLGGKLGKLAAKLTGQLTLNGGGIYFEHDDLRQLVKLVANNDANHAWMRSAGPHARKVMHALQSFANLVSHTVGRNYTEAADKPTFLSDAKIAKGFNTFKMSLLAASIDAKLGGDRFGTLVGTAYPAMSDVLTERVGSGAALPAQPRRDMPDSVAYGDRLLAYRQATASLNGSISGGTTGNTNLEAGGALSLNLRGNVMQFFSETAAAPHTLLDPGYHKDYKATFKLHQQLDEACGTEPPPAQLHLYNEMRKTLSQAIHTGPANQFTEKEHLLYGDAATVPAQFHNAIAHASREQLDHTTEQLEHLTSTYLLFTKDAAAILAKNDRFMPPRERETLNQQREAAFEHINQAVWQGRYSKQDALANPEAFIAKSHGAISLALGCAGAHLSVIKQQMAQRQSPEHHDLDDEIAIRTADSMYKTTRELLDKTYLPLKNYDVQKNGPLKDKTLWQRWDTALKAQASGGAQSSLLNTVLGRFRHHPTQVKLDDLTGSFSIDNSAGQVSLTAEARLLYADHQVNPSRTGKFWQFTFTAQGGAPITGMLVNQAVKAALEKFMPNMRLEDEKFDPHELIRQTQGLLLNITDGTSIVVKMRHAPDVENAKMQLQYVRVLRNKNSGLSASLTIPSIHGTFTPSVSHTDSTQGFAGEMVGKDLSYLMMQHPFLAKIVDDPANQNPDNLRQALDANPVQRNRYLASPHMMADVVQEYADAMAELAAAAREHRPVAITNEFLRYHAAEPFARVAQVSTQVASHAPGSTAKGEDAFKQADPLANAIDVSRLNLPAMRDHLQALETIDERADYLCNEGRPLLDAFSKIIGNMRAINSGALFHADERNIGIQTLLRDPKGLQRENGRTQAALHGKPQPAGPLGQMRARLQPAKTAVKQANLTDLQQLAGMNLPIAQKAQQELQRRKDRLGDAFPADNGPAQS